MQLHETYLLQWKIILGKIVRKTTLKSKNKYHYVVSSLFFGETNGILWEDVFGEIIVTFMPTSYNLKSDLTRPMFEME